MTTAPARPWPTVLATAALAAVGAGALSLSSSATAQDVRPDRFTSTIDVVARGGEVVADVDGDSQATAAFSLQLNSELDVLCYTVTSRGVDPPYMSPARTATHLHQGAAGASGPPRVVFADPAGETDPRSSSGCVQGPFTTGVTAPGGGDTGAGFSVADLEADPTAFYVDLHTSTFPGGSVRAQLTPATPSAAANAAPAPAAPAPAAAAPAAPAAPAPGPADGSTPSGGVAAGLGGLASSPTTLPTTAALAAALVVLGAAGTAAAAHARVPVAVRTRRRG